MGVPFNAPGWPYVASRRRRAGWPLPASGIRASDPYGAGFIGVNLTGLEYAWGNAPSNADLDYLASKRISFARINTGWERWQPTLNGALDGGYVSIVRDLRDRLTARGIVSVLDLHNNGRYDPDFDPPEGNPTGVYDHGAPGTHGDSFILGSEGLPASAFVDLWERIATEFEGEFVGYGLMNEPHDIPSPNLIADGNDFDAGDNYALNSSIVTANAGADAFGGNTMWSLTSGSGFGAWVFVVNVPVALTDATFSIRARAPTGTRTVKIQMDYGAESPFNVTTTDTRISRTFSGLSAGVHEFTVWLDMVASNTVLLSHAQLEVGDTVHELGAAAKTTWQIASQEAIDAIDVLGDDTPILVCGDHYGAARNWTDLNYNLRPTRTGGRKVILEAHHYLDNGSGQYELSYEDQEATPTQGAELAQDFIDHCDTIGYDGFIGELGVPVDAEWVTALGNTVDAFQAANMPVCYWMYSVHQPADPEWWPPDNAPITIGRTDVDEARANLLRAKSKRGAFAWPA